MHRVLGCLGAISVFAFVPSSHCGGWLFCLCCCVVLSSSSCCSLWSMPRLQGDYRISFVVGPWVCGCSERSFGCYWHGEPCVGCVFLGCYVDEVLVIELFLCSPRSILAART